MQPQFVIKKPSILLCSLYDFTPPYNQYFVAVCWFWRHKGVNFVKMDFFLPIFGIFLIYFTTLNIYVRHKYFLSLTHTFPLPEVV